MNKKYHFKKNKYKEELTYDEKINRIVNDRYSKYHYTDDKKFLYEIEVLMKDYDSDPDSCDPYAEYVYTDTFEFLYFINSFSARIDYFDGSIMKILNLFRKFNDIKVMCDKARFDFHNESVFPAPTFAKVIKYIKDDKTFNDINYLFNCIETEFDNDNFINTLLLTLIIGEYNSALNDDSLMHSLLNTITTKGIYSFVKTINDKTSDIRSQFYIIDTYFEFVGKAHEIEDYKLFNINLTLDTYLNMISVKNKK